MEQKNTSSGISSEDFKLLTEQLGRPPEGAMEVMVRDRHEVPVVFRAHPVVRNKPFPNLYWLSHPKLKKEIDRIEASGLIKELEENALPQNPQLLENLHLAHERYIQKRLSYLESEHGETPLPESFLKTLKTRGIGGLADFRRVRCLHMHYAHHLVDGNPIGKYLDEHFPHLTQTL